MSSAPFVTEGNVRFKAVRSGGPGGQRANRRSTKVQIWVTIGDLPLSDTEKRRIREKLAHHVNRNDELEVERDGERFQIRNREDAIAHMNTMIAEALVEPPPRIPTEPPRSAEERRILEKKQHSEKKRNRRN